MPRRINGREWVHRWKDDAEALAEAAEKLDLAEGLACSDRHEDQQRSRDYVDEATRILRQAGWDVPDWDEFLEMHSAGQTRRPGRG